MKNVSLETAIVKDAANIFDIQVKAFSPLLEKYKDFDTSPANESVDRVIARITNPQGKFYKIMLDQELVGAICVLWKESNHYWISPMFIDPEYQGQGIAQKAILLAEEMYPKAISWELATILEEASNCYLYEKMGYTQTEEKRKINDNTTLVYYEKSV
ncbi:GNAT family N-acetyltransferase [Paenisporosarcina indica]|uniref:GNAT family N-acetyltransferase n=1 Tax=Paenisporosarcina indica TaxID=650093 RepID=UPI00094F4FFF|nr:GNAT family N-acetyltransferase [Paenisporosarcina indica]